MFKRKISENDEESSKTRTGSTSGSDSDNDGLLLSQVCETKVGDQLIGKIDDAAYHKAVSGIRFSCIDSKKRIISAIRKRIKESDEDDEGYYLMRSERGDKETLSEVIEEVYRRLLEKYETKEKKDNNINLLWGNNLIEMNKNHRDVLKEKIKTDKNEWNCQETSTNANASSKAKKKCAEISLHGSDESKVTSQSVTMLKIPKVTTKPNCTYWTKTTENVVTDDSKYLTHLPYFSEDVEDEFFSQLLENYENKFHNEANSDSENKAFFELVHTLMFGMESRVTMVLSRRSSAAKRSQNISMQQTSPEKNWIVEQPFPSHSIFKAITKALPELGLPKSLSERYVEVCMKMFPTPKVSDSGPGDDSHGFMESMFCDRCFIYGCVSHDKDDALPPLAQREHEKKVVPMQYEFTGCKRKDCILQTTHKLKSKNDLEDKSSFNHHEKLIYELLSIQIPGNFCLIAHLLRTKTCRDVFTYSQKTEGKAAADGSNKQPPKSKIEKRKIKQKSGGNVQQWLRHYKSTFEQPSDTNNNLKPRYIPCHHPGEICSELSNCQCFLSKTGCDKFCACSIDCYSRFPGCVCKGSCTTNSCPCQSASRECDPELCGPCQKVNPEKNEEPKKSCRNDNLQRHLVKKVSVEISPIDGYGLFVDEPISKGEFIIEYCGEKISHDEAERRGAVYDKRRHTFLFDLNEYFVLDATRIGTDARFINSSPKPNCEPRALMVNGDHRLGIFAKRNIDKGEELFIDYHSVLSQHKLENASNTKKGKTKKQ